ncbi:hypothetical protein [Rhizobium sp. RU36D]|uniref:CopG family ribbon-helix-helix protein n=1 Tax=Rhizobium sp. RU36D TaxID=1907415 RepID=UPI00117A0A47|nr:hypothetical protein [Rhizobium sp. RU36D]
MSSKTVSVTITGTLAEDLCRLSENLGQDVSTLVEEAAANYVERLNWEFDSVEEALLSADEGRFISHEAMTRWLKSWGTENELPPPEPDVFKAPARGDSKP